MGRAAHRRRAGRRGRALPAGRAQLKARATGPQVLAAGAIAGLVASAGSVASLALARPDLSISSDPISEYVHGPFSYVQIAVFLTVGVGSLALARATWLTATGRRGRGGALLVALWGVGMIVAAIIDVEDQVLRTEQGVAHNVVVKVAFLAVTGAMVLAGRWRRGPATARSRSTAAHSPAWVAMTTLALIAAALLQGGRWFGVAQRLLAGTVVGWLVAVGLGLVAAGRAETTGDRSGSNGD